MSLSSIFALAIILGTGAIVNARAPLSVRLGSVFLEGNGDAELHECFRQSVAHINDDVNILADTRLDTDMQYTKWDAFEAYQKTCMEMNLNVMAVFGSSPPLVDTAVSSVCSALHIPYFTTSLFPPPPPPPSADSSSTESFVVRVGPLVLHLVEAVSQLVERMKWKNVAYVAHRKTSSLDPQLLVERLQQTPGVTVHLLELAKGDIRPELVQLRNRGVDMFVVDLGAKLVLPFFDEAMKAGIVHERSTFLLTDLDFASVDLDAVSHTGAAVFGFSLTDRAAIKRDVADSVISEDLGDLLLSSHRSALLYDGLQLFSLAVMSFSNGSRDMENPKVKCEDRDAPYELGTELMDAIQTTSLHNGYTGRRRSSNIETSFITHPVRLRPSQVKFGGLERAELELDVLKLQKGTGRRLSIGRWHFSADESVSTRLELSSTESSADMKVDDQEEHEGLRQRWGRSRVVVQVWQGSSSPFLRRQKTAAATEMVWEGFLWDLLERLKKDTGHNFEIRLSEDKGNSGNWTGIVGELLAGNADMGLTDMSVTTERNEVLDFSAPIDVAKMVIITQRTGQYSSTFGLLLSPFSWSLWSSMLTAYVLASLAFFLVSRVSPYQRHSNGNNNIGLCDAFWYAFAGFFFRGAAANAAKSFSARFLSATWWFFCAVLSVLYLYSLIPMLLQQQSMGTATAVTLEGLLADDAVAFGVVGNVYDRLKQSSDPLHRQLRNRVKTQPTTADLSEGLTRVSTDSTFALLAEMPPSMLSSPCFMEAFTATEMGEGYYALPFPKGSPFLQQISALIVKYGEDGTMAKLREKWFVAAADCGQWDAGSSEQESRIAAPFLLLLLCGCASLVFSMVELLTFSLLSSRKGKRRQQQQPSTFMSVLREELKCVLHCGGGQSNNDHPSSPVNGQQQPHLAPLPVSNGSNFLYKSSSDSNGSSRKNGDIGGAQKYLKQSLLRKDEVENSQL